MTLRTHHPVRPFSFGHVGHPEVDQVLDPQATGVLRNIQQVKVKGKVAFFNQPGAVVQHGLLYFIVIVRLCHHEPRMEQVTVC